MKYLTGIFATVGVSGADEDVGDGLQISPVAVVIAPDGQLHFSQQRAFSATWLEKKTDHQLAVINDRHCPLSSYCTVVGGSPADDGWHLANETFRALEIGRQADGLDVVAKLDGPLQFE